MDTSTGLTRLRELRRRFVPVEDVGDNRMDDLDHWLRYYTECLNGRRMPPGQAPVECGAPGRASE
jgi:hypothetical protein